MTSTTVRPDEAPTQSADVRAELVTAAFGLAVVAHLMANPAGLAGWRNDPVTGVVELALAVVGAVTLFRPRSPAPAAAAVLLLVDLVLDAPRIGNHGLLLGMLGLAGILARAWPRALASGADTSWLTSVRLLFLVAYSCVAFSKLNTGFLDPATSCAVEFTADLTTPLGWDAARLASHGGAARVLIWSVLAIELAIPVLLLALPRRRGTVVVGALAFHLVVGLDVARHFWDFTATLVPFYLAFLTRSHCRSLKKAGLWRHRGWAAAAGLAGLAPLLVVDQGAIVAASHWWRHLVWLGVSVALLREVARTLPTGGDVQADPLTPERVRPLLMVVPLLALLNGATPYFEIKTAASWNMYSNLLTSGGESNHLLVRATLPVDSRGGELVRIVESSDPGLAEYVGSGWAPTSTQVRAYLAGAGAPGLLVTESLGDNTESLGDNTESLGDNTESLGELAEPGAIERRFRAFRSVDVGQDGGATPSTTPRCQDVWLPAN